MKFLTCKGVAERGPRMFSHGSSCEAQAWVWGELLTCNPHAGCKPGCGLCQIDAFPLPNRSCDPVHCQAACCANPKCEMWRLAYSGHKYGCGANDTVPCCFLHNGNHINKSVADPNTVAYGLRSGGRVGPPPPAPPPPPKPPPRPPPLAPRRPQSVCLYKDA